MAAPPFEFERRRQANSPRVSEGTFRPATTKAAEIHELSSERGTGGGDLAAWQCWVTSDAVIQWESHLDVSGIGSATVLGNAFEERMSTKGGLREKSAPAVVCRLRLAYLSAYRRQTLRVLQRHSGMSDPLRR